MAPTYLWQSSQLAIGKPSLLLARGLATPLPLGTLLGGQHAICHHTNDIGMVTSSYSYQDRHLTAGRDMIYDLELDGVFNHMCVCVLCSGIFPLPFGVRNERRVGPANKGIVIQLLRCAFLRLSFLVSLSRFFFAWGGGGGVHAGFLLTTGTKNRTELQV